MTRRCVASILAAALIAIAAPASAGALTAETLHSYFKAAGIKTEEKDGALNFSASFPDSRAFSMMARLDPKTHFLYFAVLDLAVIKEKRPSVFRKSEKASDYNYGLGLTKVEWVRDTGEVRLSQSFSTEDGFSQGAFLKTLQSLLVTAEKLAPELSKL
ncbi:MAG: hypothetical protein M5R36_19855 [Deltaproteobacteria bacterium]|nr:hypothetical protein [Deltaproteobacteria bacterium]